MTGVNVKAESEHNINSGDTRAFGFLWCVRTLTGVKGTG